LSKAGQGDGNVVGHEREKIGPCGWLMSDIQAIAFIAIVVCTENFIRVDDVTESPKLAE
jgi:hypothetical protein